MTTEAREVYPPKNTPGVLRRPGPEVTPRTNIFGNGVPTREFAGVSPEWVFNTDTGTYEPVADRTNGSK